MYYELRLYLTAYVDQVDPKGDVRSAVDYWEALDEESKLTFMDGDGKISLAESIKNTGDFSRSEIIYPENESHPDYLKDLLDATKVSVFSVLGTAHEGVMDLKLQLQSLLANNPHLLVSELLRRTDHDRC